MQRKRIGRDGAERLGRVQALAELSLGQRRMLADLVDELTAQAGEAIMSQGERGYELVMLEEGSAEVVKDGERINVMAPGDFFGELSILQDGAPRSASVIALSEVRALSFTSHFAREMRERMPSVGEAIDAAADERRSRDLASGG